VKVPFLEGARLMGILTPEMKAAVADIKLCFVATCSPDGSPNVSPKGSLTVWDDDHLAFADIASPQTVKNLKQNPRLEINAVDQISRRGFRFKGTADILEAGPVFRSLKHAPVLRSAALR
jgi:predicted pyridoxine 5'-phosphate oxidase superfamily flavin-nucleotide-binding protein